MSAHDSEKKEERKVVPADQVKQALLHLGETQEGFAKAFLEQTNLRADQAEMRYGEEVVDGQPQFRIWFTPHEEANELRALRGLLDDILSEKRTPLEIKMFAKKVQSDHSRICLG